MVIFENTHPAIIDRETFAIVKELRKHTRRPSRGGNVSMFSGIVFCNDCGGKLYYCTAKNLAHENVREFISRIDVYAPYRENNQRHQRIDIYYHGIGYVFIPEPEEVEEMFQEHLHDRKQYKKEKTA